MVLDWRWPGAPRCPGRGTCLADHILRHGGNSNNRLSLCAHQTAWPTASRVHTFQYPRATSPRVRSTQNVIAPDAALDRLMKGNDRYVQGVSRRHDFAHEREALVASAEFFWCWLPRPRKWQKRRPMPKRIIPEHPVVWWRHGGGVRAKFAHVIPHCLCCSLE